jgi:nucleoside-diphosphate-sugar epimerase
METLLIVGAGDVAARALPALVARWSVVALVRSRERAEALARAGVRPVVGNLDDPATLGALTGIADRVAHLAPPPESGATDPRTRALSNVLRSESMVAQGGTPPRRVRRFVYVSTTGVYGDCGGALIDESRPVNPTSDRARRRVDAEAALAAWSAAEGTSLAILRVPGIYAADRLPVERLKRGTAALRDEDDVYTNHIHADDLAAILVAALERDNVTGVLNTVDRSHKKMGEWFDLVADRFDLPRPPRISRAEARERISPALLSFMSESRRIVGERVERELGVKLRYPTVEAGVDAALAAMKDAPKESGR